MYLPQITQAQKLAAKNLGTIKGINRQFKGKNIQMKTWTLPLIEDVQIKDNFIWQLAIIKKFDYIQCQGYEEIDTSYTISENIFMKT